MPTFFFLLLLGKIFRIHKPFPAEVLVAVPQLHTYLSSPENLESGEQIEAVHHEAERLLISCIFQGSLIRMFGIIFPLPL